MTPTRWVTAGAIVLLGAATAIMSGSGRDRGTGTQRRHPRGVRRHPRRGHSWKSCARSASTVTRAPSAAAADGKVGVETILGPKPGRAAHRGGRTADTRKRADAASPAGLAAAPTVFRQYNAPGGLRDEMAATAARNPQHRQAGHRSAPPPRRADPGREGHQGRAERARRRAGRPCSTLGAQHAREWITPEMNRRLLHHVIDGYGTDAGADPAGRHHRAVVPAGGQPGRLRLHLHRGQPAVAQEPARQQRRRPDHRRRRRRPQPQLRGEVGLRQRGLSGPPGRRHLPRPRRRTPSRRPRR